MREKSAECPLCQGETSTLFSVPCDWRKPMSSVKGYKVNWCEHCDYGQVWQRPDQTEIKMFYDVDYYTHGAVVTQDKSQKKEIFLDKLRVHLAWRFDKGEELRPGSIVPLIRSNKSDFSICEIGCGKGNNLSKFDSEGFSVFGVEPDPISRAIAKESFENVFDGTAEELPEDILNEKYDVILMSHVLEHCRDVNTSVSNIKRIISDGGVLVVETPNCSAYGFVNYRGEWPWSDLPRHLNFFTPSSLKSVLDKHGFRIVATQYRGFCRQFSNSWLENERKIWKSFATNGSQRTSPPRFKLRAWKLLLQSIFSSKAHKYDSVRLIAIKS